jgi:hypothetical protein
MWLVPIRVVEDVRYAAVENGVTTSQVILKCERNGREIRGYSKPANKSVTPALLTYLSAIQ